MVRERVTSSVELVEAHLRRIEEVNGALNAVVQLDGERALASAGDRDAALARGDSIGPLHGVPFTAKDNFEAAGLPMAIGVPERAEVVPAGDATAVARMRGAGGILLGKTNCPTWGGGIETVNEVYGRTNNPYDLTRTPGGSSGGEAAIVAAGGSPCGLGTDSGGSIRLPAHFCGLATIKPTAGLVPVTGVLDDEGQIGAMSDPRTQVGPLARSVEDAALLLGIIAGPDCSDGGVAPVAPGDPEDVEVRALRVAVCYANELVEPTAETRAVVVSAATALHEAGAKVEEALHPTGGHELTREVWRSYGSKMRAAELYRLLRRWDAYRSEMLAFLHRFDLILCPVFTCPAVSHGGTSSHELKHGLSCTTPYSLTGWPCATVRCGTSSEGLPIGVQLVAGPWRDDVALAAALHLERALGGWQPPAL